MAARQKGLLIVDVKDVQDTIGVKRRIAGIDGVLSVNFNQLNQKMFVKYEGNAEELQRIGSEIKGIVESSSTPQDKTSA